MDIKDAIVPRIYIRDISDCRRAFVGDQVVVQLYKRYITHYQHGLHTKRFGFILGILHRPLKPQQCTFVCRLNPFNADTGLFQPIRKGLPFIRNLNKTKRRKKWVTLYQEYGSSVKFKKYEQVDFKNRDSRLYMVKYLQWKPSHLHPLGAVVESIPSKENAFLHLRNDFVKYEDPTPKEKSQLEKEVRQLNSRKDNILYRATRTHKDKTKLNVFTIDPSGGELLDIAFNIDQKDNMTVIGVHVSDVSTYVEKNSQMDIEARKKIQNVNFENETPVFILPYSVCEICSILPHRDTLVVSVEIHILKDPDGKELVEVTQPEKSYVCSRRKLTFREAEDLIDDISSEEGKIKTDITSMSRNVLEMRRKRLGNEYFSSGDENWKATPKVYEMVEELKLIVNQNIARYLQEWLGDGFPVKCHEVSDGEWYEKWIEKFESLARCCIPLRPFLRLQRPGHTCHCDGKCQCVLSEDDMDEKNLPSRE